VRAVGTVVCNTARAIQQVTVRTGSVRLSYHHVDAMTHWTEEMFVDSPEVFAVTMGRRIEQTAEEVDTLLALLGTHGIEPADALDVACGIGRHAVDLAGPGVDVHGIDISPWYVESARERAADAGVEDRASFEAGDMRALADRTGSYDLVTNMWTAFGYFDEETNERVAEGFRERVATEGALVMELVNKEGVMADYRESNRLVVVAQP
jgi:cyclopropane fatty-acyl-phospholipid synthase-like methyltransferase